jgi:DNA-binding CsgD family transcriptional regulator
MGLELWCVFVLRMANSSTLKWQFGRQREVMELAVAGLSSKEIGIRLNISPKTVENHRAWVMERIGARNVSDLIRKAMKIRSHKERLK